MKRDGKVVDFEDNKITEAIRKSLIAVRDVKADGAESLSLEVMKILEKRFPKQIPGVEDIQDIVEEVLMKNGYSDVARAYILYRQKRAEIRRVKDLMGVRDELKLSVNAANILKRRYLQKNKDGGLESPSQMFRRVAEHIERLFQVKGETLFYNNPLSTADPGVAIDFGAAQTEGSVSCGPNVAIASVGVLGATGEGVYVLAPDSPTYATSGLSVSS